MRILRNFCTAGSRSFMGVPLQRDRGLSKCRRDLFYHVLVVRHDNDLLLVLQEILHVLDHCGTLARAI
jgi:hypothetical protein